jgi:hypothetical protein
VTMPYIKKHYSVTTPSFSAWVGTDKYDNIIDTAPILRQIVMRNKRKKKTVLTIQELVDVCTSKYGDTFCERIVPYKVE